MATGLKVTEEVYQDICRRRREDQLGAETIGKQLGLAKSTVQKAFARMDAEASRNGQGPAPTIVEVPLDQIHVTFDTQARVTIDSHVECEYAEAMKAYDEGLTERDFPPVVLFRDAQGRYWPGDGHHRIGAARQAGRDTIRAEVREGGPREAFLYACEANLTHGLRPDALDKRHALRRLLEDEEWAQWSDRELGRRCGLDHKTVAKYRPGVTGEIPSERTYTTKHGTVTTMDTTRIGTRPETPAPGNGGAPEAPQAAPAPDEADDDQEEAWDEAAEKVTLYFQTWTALSGLHSSWMTHVHSGDGHRDRQLPVELVTRAGADAVVHIKALQETAASLQAFAAALERALKQP